ncbi:MAG: NAD(P)-dependent oxidoreductase [Saprospiraceae bacterium]|nr:NAD(P)-dependent oxidoreductase [Saprospiraceae bacterium]MDW8484087.1 NAD(P)-dependent oxidoreductase [Saprospiraceae bacterium]
MIKIGIIREGKIPPDARTPLTPQQCQEVSERFSLEVIVQPSRVRCFSDEEYAAVGVRVQEDVSNCDFLLGVKEVPISQLIPGKTYLFFSHTVKKQPHNRSLLQAILEQKIRLIDYERLTDDRGDRLIAFGFYAGLVGAHNALWTYGKRSGLFTLPRMYLCRDYAEVKTSYCNLKLPPIRIVLTGSGRVAAGVIRNLHDMNIRQVAPRDFLKKDFDRPVFTQLFPQDYVQHRSGPRIFDKAHFYAHGDEYISIFKPYTHCTDIFINGIYYDPRAPKFFTLADMAEATFRIQVIADISCDLAPHGAVPTTIRPSTIAEPVYGIHRFTGKECPPFTPEGIDVMAIDNLPSELPRDASGFFGQQLIANVLPELLQGLDRPIIRRATIAEEGHLTEPYRYLSDYVYEMA